MKRKVRIKRCVKKEMNKRDREATAGNRERAAATAGVGGEGRVR